MLVQYQINALTDVHRDRNFRAVVQEFQAVVLLRSDINGGGNLFAGHGLTTSRERTWQHV